MEISKELEGKIRQAETVEDVVRVCADAGIDVTKEQLLAADMPEGELDETALDLVSGGSVLGAVAWLIWGFYKNSRNRSSGSGAGGACSAGGGGGGGGGSAGGR